MRESGFDDPKHGKHVGFVQSRLTKPGSGGTRDLPELVPYRKTIDVSNLFPMTASALAYSCTAATYQKTRGACATIS
jgi:hypothetical protein